ncbi:MAG: HAD-IA family hydrolase [Firmicutes bacterium]|nr:HAD-IA family hydrolase [Bacillota bacterium]
MEIRAVLFDLDDTLYDEWEYVRQAFENTAAYLADRLGMPDRKEAFYRRMLELTEEHGRGKVFDILCEELGIGVPVSELVQAYRSTKPILRLYPDGERLLQSLKDRGVKTGLITDGCSQVQHEKIKALGLEDRLDSVIVTDDFGLCKPQTAVYEKCLRALDCAPNQAVYVGDNPLKDFIGAKALGMKTVRIIREKGMYMGLEAEPGGEAEYTVRSLEKCERNEDFLSGPKTPA